LIQAILLHAYWYISGNDQKDPWYWLGICISLATSLGMNQEITYVNKDVKTRRLWRRIWWTCVSRDRITTVTTRKPTQILDEAIHLPALKYKDFDTVPYTTNIRLLQDLPLMMDCVGKVMLADMFMSKINVLLIIGRIFRHIYVLQGFAGSPSDWTMFYIPKKKRGLDADYIFQLQGELSKWSNTLNTHCQMDYHDDYADEISARVMLVHRAVLRILQAMAQEALHRPQSFSRPQSPTLSDTETPMNESRAISRCAASTISDILQKFQEDDLLKYLPPLSVGCALAATSWCLVEIRLENKSPAELPDHQFHLCFGSMLKLREIWPVAEGACVMISYMIANNQIVFASNIRMLSTPMASNEASDDNQQNRNNRQKDLQDQVEDANADITVPYDSSPVNISTVPSTYRAFMYPFFCAAQEFDFYNELDPNVLFVDHSIEGYGVNNVLNGGISEYPSSGDPTIHNIPNISLVISPET
jgi:hypothetical protein